MPMMKKLLIANRGEIACRIARTCQRMGIAAVGVHSTADADSLHVRTIGESIAVGGPAASDSYLRIDAVIAAALATNCDAIHPGFGFLAENATFARAVESAGLVFIGPRPETIERLGDKAAAKKEATAAGVPIIPGTMSPTNDANLLLNAVRDLDLPVMLKAAAGGGGKGMRAISTLDGLSSEISSAMREAKNAFGDDRLIVEKLIRHGRHIEVQIAGDGCGDVVHMFERECSLQRRHQKLIEEAPAANLALSLLDAMLADAVRLGQRLQYRGVGTVEFIVSEGSYYFLEVNPRLQVEHPVTEMTTGIDIVETMIRIAAGQGLPFRQEEIISRGHAVEARICAEDANNHFMPSTGEIAFAQFPSGSVRVESGIENGSQVTPYYDSMLAKIICHAPTRADALNQLKSALEETAIFGVTTNVTFLRCLLDLPETRAATFHTRLIDDQLVQLLQQKTGPDPDLLAVGACFWLQDQRQSFGNPWRSLSMTGWQMSTGSDVLSPIPLLHLESNGTSVEIRFGPRQIDGTVLIGVNDTKVAVKLTRIGDDRFAVTLGGRSETARIQKKDNDLFLRTPRGALSMTAIPYLGFISSSADLDGDLRAPMTGVITRVNAALGSPIQAGDAIVIMESMKMELRISSKLDGTLNAIHVRVGDTVERNAIVGSVAAAIAAP